MIRDKTMLKNKFMIVLIFLVLCTAGLCRGEVVYVDANSPGTDNGESWADAYTDLQSALGDVAFGDQIWVAAGVYKPTTGSDTGARFSLVDGVAMYGGFAGWESSVNKRDCSANKVFLSGILEGDARSSYVVLAWDVGLSTVLDGFTITGGDSRGMYCYDAEPNIVNCVISDNNGDGITCNVNANLVIRECVIENNGQDGIDPISSSATITNCIIRDNIASGIIFHGGSNAIIKNNMIHHNTENGIVFLDTSGTIVVQNNTIVYNSAGGISKSSGSAPGISNCILWGNSDDLDNCSATYSCIEDPDTGDGVIHSDPCFAYADPELWNFHLAPESLCIDAGDPCGIYAGQVDIDGDDRVINSLVDMGAEELACDNVSDWSDYDADGIVNLPDFAFFAGAWESHDGDDNWQEKCDYDGDGVVDVNDLPGFAEGWCWQACWRPVETQIQEDVFDFAGHWME